MSVAEFKDAEAIQVSSSVDEHEGTGYNKMQDELQRKGATLTRAWSDLFSLITKYQAELVIKENSVEIAEKEIQGRRRQLEEMKPVVDAGSEEISKLQDEIHTKEQLLNNAQSQILVKERMLQRVQSDLSCNMEQLEKFRSEFLGQQNVIIRYKKDLENSRSELKAMQEQMHIKDALLKKLQHQLMKENTDLKEQLELERQALELERQSHEMTKKTMMSRSGNRKRLKTSVSPAIIEIPDSPPTLDVDVSSGQDDYGLSNSISAVSKSQQQNIAAHRRLSSGAGHVRVSDGLARVTTSTTYQSFLEQSSRTPYKPTTSLPSQHGHSVATEVSPPVSLGTGPSVGMVSGDEIPVGNTTVVVESSDNFFPLSNSEDTKCDVSSLQTERDIQSYVPPFGTKARTPNLVTSDTNEELSSGSVLSPGPALEGCVDFVGTDGAVLKSLQSDKSSSQAGPTAFNEFTMGGRQVGCESELQNHRHIHPQQSQRFSCRFCGKCFSRKWNVAIHERIHTGEKPFQCEICGRRFNHVSHKKVHLLTHMNSPDFQ